MATIEKNAPALWSPLLPWPQPEGHKFDRGHLLVLGGDSLTGAARLAAEAGMRAGAGVCSIIAAPQTQAIYLAGAPHIMFAPYQNLADFAGYLADARVTAAIMGPGAGRDAALRAAVVAALRMHRAMVLDADALNVFEDHAGELLQALHPRCVLTPHEGEFARLFPDISGDRVVRARSAAQRMGCVLVLKGAQTVIAAPDGRVIVNDHAAPWLATAGAGDVLAGMIGGLLAQGMDPVLAACAAVWIHGEIALRFGPGLIAPDIIAGIPAVLRDFA